MSKEPFRIGDRMSLQTIFKVLFIPALGGLVLGALGGYGIGIIVPEVYGRWLGLPPETAAIGGAILGAMQLAVVGLLIGAFVVVIAVIKAKH